MKKRILSAVTAFVMFLTLIPQFTLPAVAADETPAAIIYSRTLHSEAMLNMYMTENESYFNNYVETAGGYNMVSRFGMDYNMGAQKLTKDYYAEWPQRWSVPFRALVENGEIAVKYGGVFKGDKHTNVWNHAGKTRYVWHTMTLREHAELVGPGDDTRKEVYSDWQTFKTPSYEYFYIRVAWHGSCSTCGSTTFSNPALALADTKAPTVTSWYMSTTPDGRTGNNFSSDVMYFHVNFSEPIRFADDSANHGDVYLGLELMDINTNQSYEGALQKAYLYSLEGSKMVFKYEVPKTLPNGQVPNHYVYRLSGMYDSKGSCVGVNDKYTKKLFVGENEMSGAMLESANKNGYTKSDSLITDIAGNELVATGQGDIPNLTWGVGTAGPHMDLVKPYIEKIDLEVRDENGNVITASGEDVNLYAKPGSKYRFTVQVSELLRSSDMEITLNIKNEQGANIVLSPDSSGSLSIPNNPPEKQLLYYNLTLTEGMTPSQDDSVQVIAVGTPQDMRGNDLDASIIPAIAQDSFPDLLGPAITTTKTETDGVYEVGTTEDDRTVAFDFTLSDDTSHGAQNAGGIIPMGTGADLIASLTLAPADETLTGYGSIPFEYAIGVEGVDEITYQSALLGNPINFSQTPAAKRTLYIRVSDAVPISVLPLKLSITGSDIAGNTKTTDFVLDADVFRNIVDTQGPSVSFSGGSTKHDEASGMGSIEASVTLTDISGVLASSIEYAWMETGVTPTESDWQSANFNAADGEAVSGTLTKSFAVTTDTQELSYDLYIRAKDKSLRENLGTAGPKTYTYNILYPRYTVSAIEGGMHKTPTLTLDWEAFTPPEAGSYVGALVFLRPVTNNTNIDFSDPNGYVLYRVGELGESGGTANLLTDGALAGFATIDPTTGKHTLVSNTVNADFYNQIVNGEYYGSVEVVVKVGYNLLANELAYEYPTSDHSFKFNLAGNCSSDKFDVTATWDNPDAVLGNPDWNPNETDEVGGLSTLAGQAFTVTIDPKVAPEYGISDVDFANSYAELEYSVHIWEGDGTIQAGESEPVTVARFPLTGGTTRVILPDGLPYYDYNAYYKLKTHVQTISGAGIDTDGIDNTHFANGEYIEFDPQPILPFGLAKVEEHADGAVYPYNSFFSSAGVSTWYGYASNREDGSADYTQPGQLVLGTYSDGVNFPAHNYKLFFTANAQISNYQYIQIRNKTTGVNWSGSWQEMSNAATSAYAYDVVVYSSAAEAAAAPTDTRTIPVVAGIENTIEYQARTKTGFSQTYSITILPDNTMDEVVISVNPSNSDEPQTSATAVIEKIPTGAAVKVARRESPTSPFVWSDLTETEFQFNMGEVICFYVRDLQGNIAGIDASAPDSLWTKAPTLTSDGAWTEGSAAEDTGNVASESISVAHDMYKDISLLKRDGFKLHLSVNEEYGDRIGASSMTYYIPPAEEWNGKGKWGGHRFTADETNRSIGVFSFDLYAWSDTEIEILDLQFVHRYDSAKAEGEKEEVTLTFTVEDSIGNLSEPITFKYNMDNIEPKLLGVTMPEVISFENFANGRTLWLPSVAATVPIAEIYPNAIKAEERNDDIYRTTQSYYMIDETNGIPCWIKPFASVYRDGVYDIGFVDMFGDYYKQSITQPVTYHTSTIGESYNTGMDITFSEPDASTGKVTMNFKAQDERMYVDIAQGTLPSSMTPGVSSGTHTILAARTTEATVELDPDKLLFILRYDPHEWIYNNRSAYMSTFDGAPSVMVIPNFVNAPTVATVNWYFDEFNSSTLPTDEDGSVPTTTGANVTAYLSTNTGVYPINGKGMSHTFIYGESDSYTFEFEDYNGEQGELTVKLSDIPIRLSAPIKLATDETAPDYSVEIYGKYNAVYESQNEYQPGDSHTLDAAIGSISYVQGYLLSFKVTDESPTKLIVKKAGTGSSVSSYSAVSDLIEGVSVTGTQVAINSPTAFDVVIIDSSNNKTVVAVAGDSFMFDQQAPWIEDIAKEQTNFYEVTAYVLLEDNVTPADEIRWLYPAEARRITSGEYEGRYALIFTGNEAINIRFADAVGNVGTGIVSVDELDTSTPQVKKITWSPGKINADGTMDDTTPPAQMINSAVTAVVEFSTQIQELNVARTDGEYLSSNISALLQEDQAIITFSNSDYVWDNELNKDIGVPWDLTLEFTGVNGITGSYNLKLDPVIDVDIPYVNPDFDDTAKAPYVDVFFYSMEDFYIMDGDPALYKAGETIYDDEGNYVDQKPATDAAGNVVTRRVTENGIHSFRFADAAGNVYEAKLEVTNIDNEAPLLILDENTLPSAGASAKEVKFKATLNEGGSITVNGVTQTVGAPTDTDGSGKFDVNECNWVEFTVTENGGYIITATDEAGLVTQQYLAINCIDRTAPGISFSPSTVEVIQNAAADVARALLESGVTVWDTVSKAEDISYTNNFAESMLASPGVYTITYTATDKAGNEAEGKRYLRVYSANELQVLLNGVKTFRKEVALLSDDAGGDTTSVTLDISNLPGGIGEPYTVYLRQGRWSEGQMKRNFAIIDETEFAVDKNKYYTLYIVTQSRETYLTNFYVQ